MKTFTKDKLNVKVMDTRAEMGKVAAEDIYNRIKVLLDEKQEINMIFAAAPSQNDVLEALIGYEDIEWNRINAFHTAPATISAKIRFLQKLQLS